MGDDHLHFIGEELKQQFGNMPRSHSEQQNRETETPVVGSGVCAPDYYSIGSQGIL